MLIEQNSARPRRSVSTEEAPVQLPALPTGVGGGRPFDYPDVEKLWRAVVEVPTLRIITARELALVWYGEATEENTEGILVIFRQAHERRYLIRQSGPESTY